MRVREYNHHRAAQAAACMKFSQGPIETNACPVRAIAMIQRRSSYGWYASHGLFVALRRDVSRLVNTLAATMTNGSKKSANGSASHAAGGSRRHPAGLPAESLHADAADWYFYAVCASQVRPGRAGRSRSGAMDRRAGWRGQGRFDVTSRQGCRNANRARFQLAGFVLAELGGGW